MIEQSQKAGARVLLVGMQHAAQLRRRTTRSASRRPSPSWRRRTSTALVPFLLEGFADKPEFFQPDRIHPTEAAQPLMLERVWKALRPLLK